MKCPTIAEVRDALSTIEAAEQYFTALMEAAGIPRGSASIHKGYTGHPTVAMHASKRVFVGGDGKRNLEHSLASFGSAAQVINEAGEHLKSKPR